MAVTANSIITQQSLGPNTGVTFVNADGTTAKTLVTANAIHYPMLADKITRPEHPF